MSRVFRVQCVYVLVCIRVATHVQYIQCTCALCVHVLASSVFSAHVCYLCPMCSVYLCSCTVYCKSVGTVDGIAYGFFCTCVNYYTVLV